MIAERAAKLVGSPSPLVVAHFACAKDPYDARTNPSGYINFGTAETHLLWDVLAPQLAAAATASESDIHYAPLYGTDAFREAIARLMTETMGAGVGEHELVVASGASAILDILAYALCNEGEGILVPTPYYSGFKIDLSARAGVRIVPAPLSSRDEFALSVPALEAALTQARAAGVTVRAILVTSPNNPLGRTLAREPVADVLAFAKREGLHAVFDEIYARSTFGAAPFASALSLAPPHARDVHVVYGFAKDFGLSGFKVGVLASRNADVVAACRALAYLCPVSTHTQATLTRLLADASAVARLERENRARLRAAHTTLTVELQRRGIRSLPADAGVFAWLDLREFLATPTFEAERALHQRIFTQARVNITPGGAFECNEPGWFRLCYAQDADVVRTGVARIAGTLESTRHP